MAGTAGFNLVTMALGSVGGILLARQLGPAERGEIAVILQWPAVAGTIGSLGITQATCYWIAKNRDAAASLLASAAMAAVVSGCIIAAAGIGLIPLISREGRVEKGLLFLFLFSPVFIVGGVWTSALQATNIRRWNLVRAVQPCSYLACMLVLWVVGLLTLASAIASFAGSIGLQAAVARSQARRSIDGVGRVGTSDLRRLYGYGWKVWVSSAPRVVNVQVDLLVLSLMPGVRSSELGNYAVAASLSWMALPVSIAFGSVAFPLIAAASPTAAARIERKSIAGAAFSAAITIVALATLAPIVVPRLFGVGYSESVICLWLLGPGTVCLAINRVLADLLQGRGRPLYTSAAEAGGAVGTIGLLALLVPRFGIRGAAVSSSLVYALVAVGLLLALRHVRVDGLATESATA